MKVLVADIPEADEAIRACLPGYELSFVRDMREALRALHRGAFGLVVIELHFDESRMLELLEHARALERYRNVPVVCVQAIDANLPASVLKNIDVAVKALGGMAFLDLRDASPALPEHCGLLERAAGPLMPS